LYKFIITNNNLLISKIENSKLIFVTLIITILIVTAFSTSLVLFLLQNQSPQIEDYTVRIGVVDSGCAPHQSSFVYKYESFINETYGYDFADNSPYDVLNHGNRVCSIIHQNAPEAVLISAKIASIPGSGSPKLTYQALFAAVKWLVEIMEVDIINLSLGSIPFLDGEILKKFESYADQGVIFVAAVGNDGTNHVASMGQAHWPAILPWVIGVGAKDNDSYSEYSSFGKNVIEYQSVDFSETGKFENVEGTSFSAPILTGKLGQVLFLLRLAEIIPSFQSLKAILIELSEGYSTTGFHERLGWGSVKIEGQTSDSLSELYNKVQNNVYINGGIEFDFKPRFIGEQLIYRWIVTYPNNSLIAGDINLNLNNQFEHLYTKIPYKGSWGYMLEIGLEVLSENGTLNFSFNHKNSNEIEMHIQNGGIPHLSILFDNSNNYQGILHPYGQITILEQLLRNKKNAIVSYTQTGFTFDKMLEFDLVILLNFGQIVSVYGDLIFSRNNISHIPEYLNYLNSGGNLIVMAGSNNQSTDFVNTLINPLGIELDHIFNHRIVTSNFTKNANYNSLFQGVISTSFEGRGVKAISNNVTEFSWGIASKSTGISTISFSVALGVIGKYNSGNFIVYNNLEVYFNNKFNISSEPNKDDRFMLNLIDFLRTY
jgi:hypothetical protein